MVRCARLSLSLSGLNRSPECVKAIAGQETPADGEQNVAERSLCQGRQGAKLRQATCHQSADAIHQLSQLPRIKECLPPPSPETLILMCGPPPMVEFACRKNLQALGYEKDRMVSF
eukprot:s1082_g15.t1